MTIPQEEEVPIVSAEPKTEVTQSDGPAYYDDPEDYEPVADDLDYEEPNNSMNSSTS